MKNSSNVGGGAQGAAAKNGEALFCGKDVSKTLGYTKTQNTARNLDVLKQGIKVSGSLRKDGTRTMHSQMMLFVNESCVYPLVFAGSVAFLS